jgi:hypothetical protein
LEYALPRLLFTTEGAVEDLLGKIRSDRKELVAGVRAYVRAQKEEWRRVPWLALHADGWDGVYSARYQYAYLHGFWLTGDSNASPAIDCATGELVGLTVGCATLSLSDWNIVGLSGALDKLDAARALRHLEQDARRGIRPRDGREKLDERPGWREKLIMELKLDPLYVRHPRPAVTE